jgi:hypothetical protein
MRDAFLAEKPNHDFLVMPYPLNEKRKWTHFATISPKVLLM